MYLIFFLTLPITELSLVDNHCPWHCWLGHLTHKIIPEMTYNMSSGMLNPTLPYLGCTRVLPPGECIFAVHDVCQIILYVLILVYSNWLVWTDAVCRAVVEGTEIKADCQLLKPMSLAVKLTRNLSASWYHGHPDVELHGRLENFSVCMLGQRLISRWLLCHNTNFNSHLATIPQN